MLTTQTLDLNDARTIIDAGNAEAERIGNPMNIAVVDAGGCLLAFARMDDAWRGSVDIAIGKAWTARAFDVEGTSQVAEGSGTRDHLEICDVLRRCAGSDHQQALDLTTPRAEIQKEKIRESCRVQRAQRRFRQYHR
jgi:hypothetical protein